jgi:hypothetical protein
MNAIFGGRSIANATSRIIFTNSALDPWKALSVPYQLLGLDEKSTSEIYSWVTPDVSHCAELREPTARDSLAVVRVHRAISSVIKSWLN